VSTQSELGESKGEKEKEKAEKGQEARSGERKESLKRRLQLVGNFFLFGESAAFALVNLLNIYGTIYNFAKNKCE